MNKKSYAELQMRIYRLSVDELVRMSTETEPPDTDNTGDDPFAKPFAGGL
ncbi:MAG: hypothetical protein IJ514_05860 [Clostridia bacterium]|nr:hypothetical protein [Clostridia bacterium]